MQKWDAKTQAYVSVPNAMIGVVFTNHKIDMEKNKFEKEARVDSLNDACSPQRIMANEDGQFSYSVPKSGWWGFSAIAGVGGEYMHK